MEKENKKTYFKIDSDYLMRQIKGDRYQIIRGIIDAVRAIFYFLEAGKFQINEDLYNSLDDDGKKFFKKV